ncbi:ribosomal recycling factor protein [Apiospora rasikravindrae]|uniref:Ribosomal recycling factor protein n=1 Tax=Apiospora rasikravindrae TaxID=990691 RepID=A0ABR1RNE1_9PEZI
MTARTSVTTVAALLRQSSAPCELRSIAATPAIPIATTPRNLSQCRSLHTTPIWLKKKGREEKEQARARPAADSGNSSGSSTSGGGGSSSQHPTPTPEEALDFADVHSRLTKLASHANESLKKIKSGGRFNPDLIGSVKVQPDRKESSVSYPIRELASVIPKGGRTISLLVHEAAYIKPIMSAVQAHRDFNQQPQRSPDNELELILKVEPEKREDLAKRVKAICHDWRERIRDVRQRRDKLHAAWKKDGSMLPDAKRKADTELDKVIKAEVAKVDAAEKETMKAAESK